MQVEHYARTARLNSIRGGQSTAPVMVHGRTETPRLQSAEAVCRLNTNLQSFGGGQARQSDWKRQKEGSISLGISPSRKVNGGGAQPTKQAALGTATHGMYQPGVCNQKKKYASDLGKPSTESEPTALHRLQYRERQHSLPTIKGGGRICPSQAVCLTMPRWRYPRTA